MRRKALVIGIGAGGPDLVTVQAVKAMNRASVFFIPEKGAEKAELAEVRREILARHVSSPHREVAFAVPERRSEGGYDGAVSDWHEAIADIYEHLLSEELAEGETGAFLVWGDPSLYDSAIRILERVAARGRVELEFEVLPGISSVQVLAARHRVPLNNIGQSILFTSGRQADADADSVVVMLNAEKALAARTGDDVDVFWGAYLGMPDEILVRGRLADVADEIMRRREEARERKGWIMDTVLFKRRRP